VEEHASLGKPLIRTVILGEHQVALFVTLLIIYLLEENVQQQTLTAQHSVRQMEIVLLVTLYGHFQELIASLMPVSMRTALISLD
jgi:hypothetical protein